MRSPRIVGVLGLAACLAQLGCSALPWLPYLAQPNHTEVSPPGEDGTRYVMVRSGRFTSPRTLERRWRATAEQTCDGEPIELSQAGYAQRQAGIIRSRIHEGYVQCLLPDGTEPGVSPGAPTVADATTESADRNHRPAQPTRTVGRR